MHFDLIIIGSGSGNSVITPAMKDWRIALVEESTFGGTCLNVGCIPTKMFVYAAEVAESARTSSRYGVDAHVDGVRWPAIRDRIFGRIDPISAGGRSYRAHSDHVTLFEAHAQFTGPRELSLSTGERLTADRVVVATGSRAIVPDVIAESGVPFHTSDTIMRLDALPNRLIILGGGYIAAEFAHVFSALGVQISLVTRGPGLLRNQDAEISSHFTRLAEAKWDVHLNAEARHATGDEHGVMLKLADGRKVSGTQLLIATGRTPNSDRLRLDLAGVDVGDDDLVVVDEFQRTTAEGVWALGDVSSPAQLKHVANQDARIVAYNLTHPDELRRSNHRAIPSAVFTDPQVASVGITEGEALAQGLDFTVKTQRFGDVAYGWAMEDNTGLCKVIADRQTGLLLGAHMLGPQSSSLIQPLIQAMTFGQRVDEIAHDQYWIHPALAEVVENALLGLELGGQAGYGRVS